MSIFGGLLGQVLRYLAYSLLHIFIFSQLPPLLGAGLCFFYLGYLLFLPLNTPVVVQLALGFGLGLTMDIFYDTGGLHAAAALVLAYLRPWVLRLLTPRDGYDAADSVNVHQMGGQWFGVYLGLLVLLHHTAFFVLELGSFQHFPLTLGKILVSSLFTGLTLLIVQLLFFPVRRGSR